MNKAPKKFLFAVVMLFTLAAIHPMAAALSIDARLVVITHPDTADDSVKADFIQNVYLGKTSKWKSGVKADPATLKGGEIHDIFLKDLVGKSDSQFSTFWKKMVFTGKGKPPKEFDDEAAMVAFVKSTPGAIGYVSSSAPVEGVKVLKVE